MTAPSSFLGRLAAFSACRVRLLEVGALEADLAGWSAEVVDLPANLSVARIRRVHLHAACLAVALRLRNAPSRPEKSHSLTAGRMAAGYITMPVYRINIRCVPAFGTAKPRPLGSLADSPHPPGSKSQRFSSYPNRRLPTGLESAFDDAADSFPSPTGRPSASGGRSSLGPPGTCESSQPRTRGTRSAGISPRRRPLLSALSRRAASSRPLVVRARPGSALFRTSFHFTGVPRDAG